MTSRDGVAYSYDAANRLTSVGGQTYTWDDNGRAASRSEARGNLLDDGVSQYSYDAANRLTTVTSGTDLSEFRYNGLGDRYQQTFNSQTTTYTLDLAAALTQVIADGTNSYLYGVGRIAQSSTTGGTQYFLTDALGSVRQMVDENGKVVYSQTWDAYGKTSAAPSGTATTPYGFTGEMQGVGGLYLRARYYDSRIARFTTQDPWQGDPTRPGTLNAYAYVLNNPVRYTDPSGLCWDYDPRTGKVFEIPRRKPLDGPCSGSQLEKLLQMDTKELINYSQYQNFCDTLPVDVFGECGCPVAEIGPPQISDQLEFTPFWNLKQKTGLALHLDMGLGDFIGGNVSIDLIQNEISNEVSLLFTPAVMFGVGAGFSASGGLGGVYNAPDNESMMGPVVGGQLTVIPEFGGSIAYSRSFGTGLIPELWISAIGAGAEASIFLFLGYTFPPIKVTEQVR